MDATDLNKKLRFNSSDLCIILNLKKNRCYGEKKNKMIQLHVARTELFS